MGIRVASLAAKSASSFPLIPMWERTHINRMVIPLFLTLVIASWISSTNRFFVYNWIKVRTCHVFATKTSSFDPTASIPYTDEFCRLDAERTGQSDFFLIKLATKTTPVSIHQWTGKWCCFFVLFFASDICLKIDGLVSLLLYWDSYTSQTSLLRVHGGTTLGFIWNMIWIGCCIDCSIWLIIWKSLSCFG